MENRKLSSAELENKVAALSNFAHAVSHDLKAPLRHITTYSDMLDAVHGDKLGDDGRKFVRRMAINAVRAERLLNSLLEYAEAQEPRDALAVVDTAAVAREIVSSLNEELTQAQANVDIDDLPLVTAHKSRIEQLFDILLTNAITYKSPAPLQLSFTCETRGGWHIFTLADNGIGVDPKFFEGIFEPFQRLHSRDSIEGSGLGLAIAARIVGLYGGRIWAEPGEAGGSLFRFTLPEK